MLRAQARALRAAAESLEENAHKLDKDTPNKETRQLEPLFSRCCAALLCQPPGDGCTHPEGHDPEYFK